jgi:hypothetical protein
MRANGDERAEKAWERVEAKLDRLGEAVAQQGDTLTAHGEALAAHAETLAQLMKMQLEQAGMLDRIDRRLSRVEGDREHVKLLIESLGHDMNRGMDRLQDELLTALGRETRVELLAAQSLNEGRLDALERRVTALEEKA